MKQEFETSISPMQIKTKAINMEHFTAKENKRGAFQADQMLKNLAVSSALVLCAVMLRTGAFPKLSPAADVVLAAATDHSLLDEQLGKLSFVSALFPEAVLVFGESQGIKLTYPENTESVCHVWSEEEPYMAWTMNRGDVSASAGGEVVGVYHGNGAERIVKINGSKGMSCLYGNLAEVSVGVGDIVAVGDLVGRLLPGEELAFEVQLNGVSIDPAAYFSR